MLAFKKRGSQIDYRDLSLTQKRKSLNTKP